MLWGVLARIAGPRSSGPKTRPAGSAASDLKASGLKQVAIALSASTCSRVGAPRSVRSMATSETTAWLALGEKLGGDAHERQSQPDHVDDHTDLVDHDEQRYGEGRANRPGERRP